MSRLSIKKLNRQTNIAIPYLKTNNECLKYGLPSLAKLESTLDGWNDFYEKSRNDATRTLLVVVKMREVQKELEKEHSMMQQDLKHSSEIVLTEEGRKQLFIPHQKTRSKILKPIIIPKIDIIDREERKVTIQLDHLKASNINHRKLSNPINIIISN